MTSNSRLCPLCNKGEMRKRQKVIEEQSNQPFWQEVVSNQLVCNICGHIVQVSMEFKLTNTSEAQAKRKDTSCSSCDKKKVIVFERGNFRLCKECLENVREEHNLDKGI
jgi:C4-type Zn-finger protein